MNSNSVRAMALARRRAMSVSGKAANGSAAASAPATQARTGSAAKPSGTAARPPVRAARPAGATVSGRNASRMRRQAMSQQGKAGLKTQDRTRSMPAPQASAAPAKVADAGARDCGCGCKGKSSERAASKPVATAVKGRAPANRAKARVKTSMNPTRAAALARRQAQSTRGKAGVSKGGMSSAQVARAANPQLTGREMAQTLRSQRSQKGKTGQRKSEPAGRTRPAKKAADAGGAQDAPWKVGASETSHGQRVTGTMVGRSPKTTGDEPSTCRAVTGTEYMGADVFRDFCQSDPAKNPHKVRLSPTGHGNLVSGNEVGRSKKVTGDEPGTCKRVTGSQYLSPTQTEAFCGTKAVAELPKPRRAETLKGKAVTGNNVGRSEKVTGDEPGSGRQLTGTQYMQSAEGGRAPVKVGKSSTEFGGSVTGTMVGRGERVTGDEPGSCRNVTGNNYIGAEQFQKFCDTTPAPRKNVKAEVSQTLKGERVTGTMTGRSTKTTGDEPGTCKAITGTPYAGAEQYRGYCEPEATAMAVARSRQLRSTPGMPMTGQQPGIGGKLTGAEKGACEAVSGTPYVGADQVADACPSIPAQPGSPDFPQTLDASSWTQFSVESPSHAAQTPASGRGVTGMGSQRSHITGPFGKAGGKVTGTEDARFGRNGGASSQPTWESVGTPETAETIDGRVKSRISGEGMDIGKRITGDDWDRGDRVTGTEGMSAVRRNPTRRGGAMGNAQSMAQASKRNEELPEPVSKVTGGSGNTDKGAMVTYSGGARG